MIDIAALRARWSAAFHGQAKLDELDEEMLEAFEKLNPMGSWVRPERDEVLMLTQGIRDRNKLIEELLEDLNEAIKGIEQLRAGDSMSRADTTLRMNLTARGITPHSEGFIAAIETTMHKLDEGTTAQGVLRAVGATLNAVEAKETRETEAWEKANQQMWDYARRLAARSTSPTEPASGGSDV